LTEQDRSFMQKPIAFIGGGNMARAIIAGLLGQGYEPTQITVVEPFAPARDTLLEKFGIRALPAADATLGAAELVVWAVKPQSFQAATEPVRAHTTQALHWSVAAGISSHSLAQWLGSERVVRAMPNTPALIGLGMTGLYARAGVSAADCQWIEAVASSLGKFIWLQQEDLLDAVTALSGSGPAYVFYFIETMIEAGVGMGLTAEQARALAVETFYGSSALVRASSEEVGQLREQVTSKGGTTHAAITSLQGNQVQAHFTQALQAAQQRARALGQEFGGG
jgi:pyrroline-5-carboxylate reductase